MAALRGRLDLDFVSEHFALRTLTVTDASRRWAEWLNDPIAARMLNTRPRALSEQELRDYIASFDQTTRLLVGIFDRATGQHIGIATAHILDEGRKVQPSVLIGEPSFRHLGAISELTDVVREHFFETYDIEAAVSSVLSHNAIIIAFLEQRGWVLTQRLPRAKKSAETGEVFDVLIYEYTRETWLKRKQQQTSR
jgi:ribosomal-protein-alanine N-acetyltransferase